VLLQGEGWALGKTLAYRLYTEEGLQLRSKRPKRRKMAVTRRERYVPVRPNQAWSMEFVSDQLKWNAGSRAHYRRRLHSSGADHPGWTPTARRAGRRGVHSTGRATWCAAADLRATLSQFEIRTSHSAPRKWVH
jgi:hypothetical protein